MQPDPLDGSWGIPAVTVAGYVLRRLNLARGEVGAPPLSLHEPLVRAAQAYASDLARRGFLAAATPEGVGMAAYARREGHPGEVAGWVARAPSAEVGLQALLLDEGLLDVLRDPRCRHAGIGLRAGRFALLLGAPFTLRDDEAVGRVHMLVDHARAVRGVAPLRPSEALARLAEDALSAPPDGSAAAPGEAQAAGPSLLLRLFGATPATLDRAVREILGDPGVGPALLAPAGGEIGVAVRRRQDRFCLVFSPGAGRPESPLAPEGE